ncbi:MAG: penicillin-binding transpeptidase domain-containing protein [Chloroflexota bacterium]|nr:penicillin-binding transpeptidase domain-containing protein [Chloroflexota bacterium]
MNTQPLRRRAFTFLAWTALIVALSGCGMLNSGSGDAGSAPVIQLIARTPSDTVSAFLNAWGARDYERMYSQLSAESQSMMALPVFREVYTQADTQIGTSGVQITLGATHEQGRTAAVQYDLVVNSTIFGAIPDLGRTMRLIQAPGGGDWRVAWSNMDIFEGFAPGASLEAVSTRPPRANIVDREGRALVETDGETITLFAALQEMRDYEGCMTLLGYVMRREREDVIGVWAGYNAESVVPIGDLDPDEYDTNAALLTDLCGIRTATRTTRHYIGHGIATHVTGYVGDIPAEQFEAYQSRGYSQGDLVGLGGIEAAYETELAGQPARALRIREPGGLIVRELAGAGGVPGQSVRLTLDANLQRVAAQAISDAYNYASNNWANRAHSPGGGAVVIDVNTGAILALVSYPTYDPGMFNPDTPLFFPGNIIAGLQSDARQPFFNRVTQGQYSPGSTFKIVTESAAANERVWSPDDIFNCGMEWNGREFGDTLPVRLDWRATEPEEARFATGEVSMSQALTASCNPFFYQMGAMLYNQRGATALSDTARRMGLGTATGLGTIMPEAAGSITPPTSVEEAINNAIGQAETQVTIIQMARMVAGIANNGTLYRPYVVEQVGGDNGAAPSFVAEPEVVGDMGLSQTAFDVVRQGMCDVTQVEVVGRSTGRPLGTAWFVFDDPEGFPATYTVCGKTGTAQTGRVEPHGWFVAYAPADNPQIAVAAMIEHGREGSETAAPIVRRIMDAYFNTPAASYPGWWENEYVALNIPAGATGG